MKQANSPMTPKARVQIKSMERTTRALLMNVLRRYSSRSIHLIQEIIAAHILSEMRLVPLQIESKHTLTALPESTWMFLMKEVGREGRLTNLLTVLIITNDGGSELNCLSDQSPNLSHLVPSVLVNCSH